jgi:thiol-disulfide isomerase/thioredoxin
MRGPVAAGALAGLLVIVLVVGAFVALALGRPDPVVPTPTPSLVAGSPDGSPSATSTSEPSSPSRTVAPTGSSASPTPSEAVGLDVGDRAPSLVLPALGGNEIDTTQVEGRALWINFMATWCPPCIDELPMMQRFQRQLGEDMTILVVDVREPEEAVSDFMTSLNIELPVGLDLDGAAQVTWGAHILPVHYWIDAEGRIGGFLYGGAGPEQFIEGIQTVLPDVELEL